MIKIEHIRRQHNVGQGGFHSAFVNAEIDGEEFRYDYIYDCGALTSGKRSRALIRQIEAYRPRQAKLDRYVVDALVLSHFDRDHMNGAELIAHSYRVEQIFLPALTPQLLALEIARQAATLTAGHLVDLFDICYSESLWGSRVVRVGRGIDGTEYDEPPDRPRPRTDRDSETDPRANGVKPDAYPKPLVAVDSISGTPLGSEINHARGIELTGNDVQVWRFKFWSQNVSDELALLVITALDMIGFPLDALQSASGAHDVAAWIEGNRDDVIEAYRHAYEISHGAKLKGKANHGFANYVSMTMFSGPLEVAHSREFRPLSESLSGRMYYPRCGLCYDFDADSPSGWMGTGDAMLGEPPIWQEFSSHYQRELPEVRTILLPHHGAAPMAGPKFYHPLLSGEERINVLSFGARNTYGHPATSVLDRIYLSSGFCVSVTEDDKTSYCELVRCSY